MQAPRSNRRHPGANATDARLRRVRPHRIKLHIRNLERLAPGAPNMAAFAAFTDPVGNAFGLYEEPQQ